MLLNDQTFQIQQMLAAPYNLFSSFLSTEKSWDTCILHKDTEEGVSMIRQAPILYRIKPICLLGGGGGMASETESEQVELGCKGSQRHQGSLIKAGPFAIQI